MLRSPGLELQDRIQRSRSFKPWAKARGVALLVIGAALTLATAPGVAAAADNGSGTNSSIVSTESGPVQGFVKNGVAEFLGIAYAAPPVGSLRWMPPQPPQPWTQVRRVSAFAHNCAQNQELGYFAGPSSTSEDCLYLNVFTTALANDHRGEATRPANQGHGYPVLVWIHGGGNFDGESADYDGTALAKEGPTVVVTFDYRLGLLGFLANPALDRQGHPFGNYGIMDQQAALRWVRQNIAKFGGNPNDVALGGQSAGDFDTGANVISPGAAGLFQRAIFQSVALLDPFISPLPLSEARGTAFSVAAGCGSGTDATVAACLRALPVSTILRLQGSSKQAAPNPAYFTTGLIVDGTVVPTLPSDAWSSGRFNHMPIMNGTTEDEGAFTTMINEVLKGPLSASQYTNMVTAAYSGPAGPGGGPPNYPSGTARAVLDEYPLAKYTSPSLAWVAVRTDPLSCEARHVNQLLGSKVPVYAYEFDDRNAPSYFPAVSFPTGAYHTADIPFLFGFHGGSRGIARPLSPAERVLAGQLRVFWTTFARTGDPNGVARTDPWPRYNASSPLYLAENADGSAPVSEAQFSTTHKCSFWDRILNY
jgi:para-nitrobenzyl esterase